MQPDLNALHVFAIVAEERSFRAAADRLGVTRSAVSQTMSKLEETLGILLVRRTTRSVSLTEEGRRLCHDIGPAIADLSTAVSTLADMRGRPNGQLRLAVSSIAEDFLSGALLATFAEAHPEVQIDVTVTDEEFDIVAEGYDAGVRLGEVIALDMIAVPVSGPQRQLAVCAPAYLEKTAPPAHPRDLVRHRCIGWRPGPGIAPYRWEFTQDGKDFGVAVEPEFTTNDMGLMIRLALAGAGITFGMEDTFRASIETGALVPLLEDYSVPFAGFYLYYPNRRNLTPKLRALLDWVKKARLQATP